MSRLATADKIESVTAHEVINTIGLINDMYCESRNDSCSYAVLGTQEDMDLF